MSDSQNYLEELKENEAQLALSDLRALTIEFSATLSRVPKIKAELESMLNISSKVINYSYLFTISRPKLQQISQLLSEIDLLPKNLRETKEMDDFIGFNLPKIELNSINAFYTRYSKIYEESKRNSDSISNLQSKYESCGFFDISDTVNDRICQTIWRRDLVSTQCNSSEVFKRLDEFNSAEKLSGRYHNWRLPNFKEISSLHVRNNRVHLFDFFSYFAEYFFWQNDRLDVTAHKFSGTSHYLTIQTQRIIVTGSICVLRDIESR